MKLYCSACNEVHEMTPGTIERLVYVLQAELIEAKCDPAEDVPYEDHDCLLIVESWAHDCEMYLEHVESWVETRRYRVRTENQGPPMPPRAETCVVCRPIPGLLRVLEADARRRTMVDTDRFVPCYCRQPVQHPGTFPLPIRMEDVPDAKG